MTTSAPLPPGNLGLPWIGETLQWVADPFRFCEQRFRAHGPVWKTRIMGKSTVCCTGPEAFSKFVDTTYFSRDGASPPHVPELIGAGTLPFIDGPGQRRRKQLLLSPFRPGPMRGYVRAITPIIDAAIGRWEAQRELALYPELERLTLQVFDTLFAGADPATENVVLRRDLAEFLPGILALPLPGPFGAYRRAIRARDRLLAYIRPLVTARKEAPKEDVLSHLIAARDEAGTGLSDEDITKEMVHIFFAGYGLMSANLGYAIIALGQHEAVRERVRAEAQRPSDALTLEDLLGMTYTGQVWKEIMRVYPSAPHTFMAQVIAPVELGGYQIPAGWRAMGMIYPSLHSERYFADPERFDPDRFGPERAEDQKAPNAFVAQGGGPPESHRCLGESVSAVVMKLFLSRVVRHHSWELRSTPIIDTQFPVAPKGGVPVRFHRL